MTTILRGQGTGLRTGSSPVVRPYHFYDDFERADGAIGNGWSNGSDLFPNSFNPVGIFSGALCITNLNSRPGSPSASIDEGIGFIYRDTGVTNIMGQVQYLGDTSPHGVEATPLFHVTSGSSRLAFGAWPSVLLGADVLLIGYIGNPPDEPAHGGVFETMALASISLGTSAHTYTCRSVGGLFSVYTDGGAPVTMSYLAGGSGTTFAIDAALTSSTLHGVAIDIHLMATPSVTRRVVDAAWLTAIG